MSQKILVSDLEAKLGERIGLFIGMASFESRCLTILSAIAKNVDNFIFLKNKNAGDLANKNLQQMKAICGTESQLIELDLDKPTLTADSLQRSLTFIRQASQGIIFIDTTTFTHEQLLIFLKVLSEAKVDRKFVFGYTGAEEYSINSEPENVWLSRGVSQIRSILGFPGKFLPSRKLHLIVLVGFEHERAKFVIEQFEPQILTLGLCKPSQSISESHHEKNQKFFEEVKKFVDVRTSIYSEIDTFEFSGTDPFLTSQEILHKIGMSKTYNTVICPMNTKISTVGVGLAAIKDETIQVCYSRAITYNESGYSSPSNQVTVFAVNFLQHQ